MPHGQLLLRVSPERASLFGIPGPNLVVIQEVETALEVATGQLAQLAHEVAVDIVRVVLVLDERSVDEDVANAHLPELSHHDFEIVDEQRAPGSVPAVVAGARTLDQRRRS